MRALVYQGPKTMNIENWETPVPKAGEVRVRTSFVGICGSDVHGWLGITGRRTPPMVMGHEMSGVISALGEGVTEYKVGDKVTVLPVFNCGECDYCKEGLINICPNREFMGAMSCNGAFLDEFCIDAKKICKLPENISLETGALIEPFAVAYRGVKHAGELTGKTVMICGAGTIGLMALKACKLLGAKTIIIVDLSDDRLALAKAHGADVIINGKSDIDTELKACGLRSSIDVTIEAVGVTPTAQQSIDFVRNHGTVVWIGNSAPTITINMQSVVTRELTIHGSYIYTDKDYEECIRLLSETPQDFTGIISDIISLEEADDMFRELSEGAGNKIKVLVDMSR